MTRFTFALILVFLALTVAPAILAAPISVRRNIGFHKAPSGSESNVVIPELTLFEKMHLFSDDLTTTSSMVPQLKDGDYTVKALKKFAEEFGKFNTEKLEPALKANDEKKAHELLLTFCASHKRDLNQARLYAAKLDHACQVQYGWLYDKCVALQSGQWDGTKKSG
ncbi:hypothetical protein C8R42DRAFT_638467 [Lentinula raphanica]|nr:hypothetical protein C8R42DRAFT_638467 [Lentinula raphanica]